MKNFVLDNSVTMRWLLESENKVDQKYAEKVLKSMTQAEGLVPNLWHLEVTNVLWGAEKRKEVHLGEIQHFLSQLENLPIHVDPLTSVHAFNRTLALTRAYNISSYDASYLELAMREGFPLASLDKGLRKAAKKANIDIYLV